MKKSLEKEIENFHINWVCFCMFFSLVDSNRIFEIFFLWFIYPLTLTLLLLLFDKEISLTVNQSVIDKTYWYWLIIWRNLSSSLFWSTTFWPFFCLFNSSSCKFVCSISVLFNRISNKFNYIWSIRRHNRFKMINQKTTSSSFSFSIFFQKNFFPKTFFSKNKKIKKAILMIMFEKKVFLYHDYIVILLARISVLFSRTMILFSSFDDDSFFFWRLCRLDDDDYLGISISNEWLVRLAIYRWWSFSISFFFMLKI